MKKLLFVFNPHSGTGEICKHLAEVVDVFTKAGYDVVCMSAKEDQDFSELMPYIKGKVSAFAGLSGVGKSTILINLKI